MQDQKTAPVDAQINPNHVGMQEFLRHKLAPVLVATLGALTVTSCVETEIAPKTDLVTDEADDSLVVADPVTEADKLVNILNERQQLVKDLQTGSDLSEMRQRVAEHEDPNPVAQALLVRIIDLETAEDATSVISDPTKVLAEAADISDPTIRQSVEKSAYVPQIKQILDRTSYDPQGAVDDLAASDLPEDVRIKTEAAIQKILAAEVIKSSSYSPDESPRLATALALITDPVLLEQTTRTVELNQQRRDYLYGEASIDFESDVYDQMEADASALADPILDGAEQAREELTDTGLDYTQISSDINEAENSLQRLATQETKQRNSLEVTPYEVTVLPELMGRGSKIDLSAADSDRMYNNSSGPDEYRELGQAHIKDGRLILEFGENVSLSESAMKQMNRVFEYARPLLEAGFTSGDSNTIRFVLGDDFGPYYDTITRETIVVLPKDDSTTVDQLAMALVHETVHALTRSAYTVENVTVEEGTAIGQACKAVKDASYEHLELSLRFSTPDLLQNVLEVAKPEHKPLIQTMITAVEDGTFEQLVTNGIGESTSEFAIALNECEYLSVWNVLDEAARVNQIEFEDDELDYLFETPELKEFIKEWASIMNYASIYSKINESSFVETEYIAKESLGHSEEDTAELMASLLDAAISYPDQLATVISDMRDEDRAATIQALRATIDIVVNRHPTLRGMMSSLEAELLS